MSGTISISSTVNYSTIMASQTLTQIATQPSAVEKALHIATKIFAAMDFYRLGAIQDRKVTDAMQGFIELIEFYNSFRDIMFWVNPFSKETLDDEVLLKSLTSEMCAQNGKLKKPKTIATKVFQEVMNERAFYSADEVRAAVISQLVHEKYDPQAAKSIADHLIIKQKGRPISLVFSMVGFTSIDLMSNILTLKKWGLIDLSHLAAQIGKQSRVFAFVIEFSVETVIGTIASAALVVPFGEACYGTITQGYTLYVSRDPKIKQAAKKEFRSALLDLVSNGTDLAEAAAPLFFTLNPPVQLALALVAKSTGLICIIIK